MSTKNTAKFKNPTTYEVIAVVDKKEYDEYSAKILQQLAKNVEVQGFRKGKAPLELAMKQIDMQYAQSTILNESAEKFGTPALSEARELMAKENRSIFDTRLVDFKSPEDGKQVEFVFELWVSPEFDLKEISKMKLSKVTAKDLPTRFTRENYLSSEVKEFLATFNKYEKEAKKVDDLSKVVLDMTMLGDKQKSEAQEISVVMGTRSCPVEFTKDLQSKKVGDEVETKTQFNLGAKKPIEIPVKLKVKQILEPEYKTFEELVKSVPEAQKQFASQADLEQKLGEVYDNETKQIEKEIQYKKTIKELQKSLDKYPFDEERFPISRVVENTQEQAKKQGLEWVEYLKSQGILEESKKYTQDKAKDELAKVYRREELYLQLLRVIYDYKVEKKITSQEVDIAISRLSKEDHKGHNNSKEEMERVAVDSLVRQKALNWWLKQVDNKA